MKIVNFEYKVKVKDLDMLEQKLVTLKPIFSGEDHQVDTYYDVPKGRLKLREGNIENALIYYERSNVANTKKSNITLYRHQADPALKDILGILHGIKVIVSKKRKIYFIDNVKFHFDTVKELGTFMEVEAINVSGAISLQKLQEQCEEYFSFFEFNSADHVDRSYSDLLIAKNSST